MSSNKIFWTFKTNAVNTNFFRRILRSVVEEGEHGADSGQADGDKGSKVQSTRRLQLEDCQHHCEGRRGVSLSDR